MASSSNSSLALVTSSKKNHYDVFVTFRGEDTRNNFTDFLFDALETKNISVFRDNTNLQQGESIGPELLRAIEGSQVYVAVFSRNYASSTWCLQELEKICECVQGSEKHVLPVFYDVDPSEVQNQTGIYRESFVKHEQRFQQDFEMVSRWREALEQVASISGWDLRDRPQAGEIKKIVQMIINILEFKSYKLFCRQAFKLKKIIMSDYQNLVNEILNYANGHPLAITTLGSFLFDRNVTEWKRILARLKESPDNEVMDVLQLSYDGLNHMEKEIFLHIACFFNNWPVKDVKNILNCYGFHADIGLRVLMDKSLISISDSRINMHSLLEQLGRKIVQENSSKEHRKWSRLWSKKQLYNVIMENMEKHVEVVVLNEKDEDEIDMNVEDLSKMSNLRLLIIFNYMGNISESPSCLSNKLRYVDWYKYPFKYLPSSFQPNELVELILKRSYIKQLWKNKKYLPNLRTLDLSGSRKLEKITDFGEFPNLKWLSLEGCINLVELDPSIGLVSKLVYLNVKECENLVSIPNNIFGLSCLEDLNMCGCSKVFNNSRHLMEHDIFMDDRIQLYHNKHTWIVLPTPTRNTYLLPSLHSLDCLRNLDISFCHLSQVPDSIECLRSLERLNLRGNYFVTLPSLRKLSKLIYLNLEHCKLLESLPQLPFPTTITTIGWEQDEIDEITGLFIFNCSKLGERERCSSMTFSWMTQFIQEYQQSYPAYFKKFQIVTPGSEIPSWINRAWVIQYP